MSAEIPSPLDADVRQRAARAAFDVRDYARAFALSAWSLHAHETWPQALSVHANAAMQLERFEEADRALVRLLQKQPDHPALRRSLSRVRNRLGHNAFAEGHARTAWRYWREALTLWPDNHDALCNLHAHGPPQADAEQAIQTLTLALATNPDDPMLRLLLAESLRNDGQFVTAAQVLRSLSADDLQKNQWRELALTVDDNDLIERALPVSTDLNPRVEALVSGFAGLATLGQASATQNLAAAASTQVGNFQSAPSLRIALALHLSLPAVHADQASIDRCRAQFASGLSMLESRFPQAVLRTLEPSLSHLNWSNFLLAYQCEDDLELQTRYGDWLGMAAATLRPDLAAPSPQRKPGPPRIGLLSGHWHESTAGSYFADWIEALDVTAFETTVLALGPRFDAFTDALESQCRRLVRLDGNIDAAADAVRAEDFDLLIYPELGMDTRLLPLAALRLARRQWMGWGHPVSSGLASIDAYLSCADMEPDDAQTHYRETLITLPGLGTRYRLPPIPQRLSRTELDLPEGTLVVVPQSAFKIHPDNDEVFAELLELAPDAQLLLFATAPRLDAGRLMQRLRARLGPDRMMRVHAHPPVARSRFLEILSSADLMLDTLHWSGGNTSLDALRAGLRIATTRGRFMRGRQSAAMLQALNRPDWIACSAAELAALAAAMLRARPVPISQSEFETWARSPKPLKVLFDLACAAVAG